MNAIYEQLAGRLPPLVARLRARPLRSLALALQLSPDDPGFSARAALIAADRMERRAERRQARGGLIRALSNADSESERSAVLRAHLKQTREGATLREDLRALGRWMDGDALIERLDAEIEEVGIELELLARLLRGLTLEEVARSALLELSRDPRVPTRREAVATLADWFVERQREERWGMNEAAFDEGQVSERLIALIATARDPIVARRALRAAAALPREEIVPMLMHRLQSRPEGDSGAADSLVRAATARHLIGLGGDAALQGFMVACVDPAEAVRCAAVQGMSRSGLRERASRLRDMQRVEGAQAVLIEIERALKEPDPEPATSLDDLAVSLRSMPRGDYREVAIPDGQDALALALALRDVIGDGFDFALQPLGAGRVRIERGARRVLRAWRIFHELRNPSPVKRQGGDHLTGESWAGPIRVLSPTLAETSPTGVPGQRVLSQYRNTWSPWAPRLDDCADALRFGFVLLVSDEGVTRLEAPEGWWRRGRAALSLAWRAAEMDRLRLWGLESEDGGGRYTRALQDLGFQMDVGPSAERLGAQATTPPPGIGRSWIGPEILGLLAAGSQATPVELGGVTAAFAGMFFGRIMWAERQIRAARAKLPLVIGGWGSRGKSGTERLKAALLEGLGYNAFCKTTGCEAMVLHAPPGGRATELFLFRPFDKASIWEQASVLRMAAEIGSPVFLWECMALNPDYVEQLQLRWTRDDISTITNAYPDHEDVMGPTGEEVAEVIARFLPANARALTTETQMTPILRERAAARGTELIALGPDSSEEIPRDLLARFPYREHPANVALVVRLAKELDVEMEEALLLMAEHVVPDLGALSTFPAARLYGRLLEVTNGSSANERTGFLHNWNYCGFDTFDPELHPDIFSVTVVNNRHDRVARSKIFAEILVRDAPAHRHVLIGTNQEGLRGYIEESLASFTTEIRLFDEGPLRVIQRLDGLSRQLRLVPLEALLRGTAHLLCSPSLEELAEACEQLTQEVLAAGRLKTLQESRAALEQLRPQMEAAADSIGGIFTPRSGRVEQALEHTTPLFHDQIDLEMGRINLVEDWIRVGSEALAFAALQGACQEAVVRPVAQVQEGLVEATRSLYQELFWSHVISVPHADATGDAVIDAVARSCPAGVLIRCLSIQNIKGTGLDFIYRWNYSRGPRRWARELFGGIPNQRTAALEQISRWGEWSLPTCLEVMRALRLSVDPSQADEANALRVVSEALNRCRSDLAAGGRKGAKRRGLLRTLWDPIDAVIRRHQADQIYADLTTQRISHNRAALELQRLHERQK